MKKIIVLFSFVVLISTLMNAQYASKATKNKFSEKDSLVIGKTWNIKSIDADQTTITKLHTNSDMLLLNYDRTFNAVLNGEKKSGTWIKSEQQTILFTEKTTTENFSYEVIEVTPQLLKVKYTDASGKHYSMTFDSK